MNETIAQVSRGVAAVLSAALIGIVGVSAISPETAQAAGVVIEHRTVGAPTSASGRDDET